MPHRRPVPRLRAFSAGLLLAGLGALGSSLAAATPRYAITHFAGTTGGGGSADGVGTAARFRFPGSLAADGSGNIFVADEDNFTIRKITQTGVVTTLAGSPGVSGRDDGIGTAARFGALGSMVADRNGNLFVADLANFTIRRVTPAGVVTTLAGSAGQSGGTDGVGSNARFADIAALTIDGSGTLYALDSEGSGTSRRRSVRKISPSGSVTTFTPNDGNPTHPVSFADFSTAAIDPSGHLQVIDLTAQQNSERFFIVVPSGYAYVAASTNIRSPIGGSVFDAAGNFYLTYPFARTAIVKIAPGPVIFDGGFNITTHGTVSTLGSNLPDAIGLAVDGAGNLYTSLQGSHVIRKVAPDGTVSSFAGLSAESSIVDATGADARFSAPTGLAVDPAGNLYVADWGNAAIRKISPGGAVTTVIQRDAGAAAAAGVGLISHVAVDTAGNLYAADQGRLVVRRIATNGAITTLAGTPDVFGRADGTGPAAQFDSLHGAALDAQGNFYTAGLSAIRKITPAGVVTTLAGSPTETGSTDGQGAGARFFQPFGLTAKADGTVYVSDSYNHTIRKVSPTGVVTTIAGSPGQRGSADGIGSTARFAYPSGIKMDTAGNLYVADSGNNTLRLITPDGTVTTIAGRSGTSGSDDGLDTSARFLSPSDLAIDAAGSLYIADRGNCAIRKATFLGLGLEITTQPQSQSVALGGSVTFSVVTSPVATGYQWYLNGNALPGATGSSMAVANVSAANAGNYTVVASNPLSSVLSNVAMLTVTSNSPPGSGGGGGGSGGGGGGGAPSPWFLLALAAAGVARWRSRRA